MTRIATQAAVTVTVSIAGNALARWCWRWAERFGLTMTVESVAFDEPVATIASRLAVEAVIERSRVP